MTKIDDIKQRLDAATPGKWVKLDFLLGVVQKEDDTGSVCFCDTRPQDAAPFFVNKNELWVKQVDANAAFIATAPADIRYLLAEVERLRGLVKAGEFGGSQSSFCPWCTSTHKHADDCPVFNKDGSVK
jgi:hypothetical protein